MIKSGAYEESADSADHRFHPGFQLLLPFPPFLLGEVGTQQGFIPSIGKAHQVFLFRLSTVFEEVPVKTAAAFDPGGCGCFQIRNAVRGSP